MLYANTSAGYPQLSKALADFGLNSSTMELFSAFMDKDSGGDPAQLGSVSRIDLHGGLDWKKLEALEKAVKNELLRPDDEEGMCRYIYFCYTIGGSMCWRLLRGYSYDVSKNKLDPYIKNAFAKYLDDARKPYAKGAAYSLKASYGTCQNGTYNLPARVDVDTTVDALKFVDDDMTAAKAFLIAYALDQLDFSEGKVPEKAEYPLKVLKELCFANGAKTYDAKETDYLIIAMAEGAYFDKDIKRKLVKTMSGLDPVQANRSFISNAHGMNISAKRLLAVFESENDLVTPEYILFTRGDDRKKRLARDFTPVYIEAINRCNDPALAKSLEDIIINENVGYDPTVNDIKGRTRSRITEAIIVSFPKRDVIREFLDGERPLADTLSAIAEGKLEPYRNHSSLALLQQTGYNYLNYYGAFGRDEFIARVLTLTMTAEINYGRCYRIKEYTGFDIDKAENIKPAIEMLMQSGTDCARALQAVSICIDDMYSMSEKCQAAAVDAFESYKDGLKSIDKKALGATARVIYTQAIGRHPNEFKAELLALADDGSKAVRAEAVGIFAAQKNWSEDIKELLKTKKAAKRELALDVISKQGSADYAEALKAAFEAEKSDKIKAKIAALIGAKVEGKEPAKLSLDDTVAKLAKNARTSKLGFIFERPFKPVHKTDGTEADENTLMALVMSYAPMISPERSLVADDIASGLVQPELEAFAAEVFGRWYDNGAQAKQKGALYFSAIHGGIPMVRDLMHYIKDWGENMRGAIASEAVKAMALGGSSEALMNVDNMSRKFKNKQVRAAAADALASAAESLGITTEELADRIVPDLGFDENLCRVFEYGPRQFSVYITPSLELEIFNGDKQIKSLPKPGVNDDPDKSAAAQTAFKDMKKQLKAVVTSQKQRLEYVMLCDRKWTSESWNDLFVKNAVMHCFAIGLIWGVYEDGALKTTFRYMDDGSFTTSDEEEFTLPENAQIGLVHPIELSDDERNIWTEQLSDYEITQPFDQLKRKVYLPTDEELKSNKILRFENRELNSLTLTNKLTKLGWYKGQAEDAGFFYYFYRDDLTKRVRDENGRLVPEGNGVLLTFSGASVVVYDFEGEDVTTEKLVFYKPGSQPNYYDKEEKGFMKISDVSPRYFSEMIMQLTSVLGEDTANNTAE